MRNNFKVIDRKVSQKQTSAGLSARAKSSLSAINAEILKFVRQIVEQSAQRPKLISARLEIKDNCWLLYMYNAETNNKAGKAWTMNEFMDMCTKKKIEFEMNVSVRKLITIIEEKGDGKDILI